MAAATIEIALSPRSNGYVVACRYGRARCIVNHLLCTMLASSRGGMHHPNPAKDIPHARERAIVPRILIYRKSRKSLADEVGVDLRLSLWWAKRNGKAHCTHRTLAAVTFVNGRHIGPIYVLLALPNSPVQRFSACDITSFNYGAETRPFCLAAPIQHSILLTSSSVPYITVMMYRPAIMSASLGRAWLHDFDAKMRAAGDSGFEGIEIFYEDLEHVAKKCSASDQPSNTYLLMAADHCYSVCHRNGLEIIGLQPFLFYEGLKDREKHDLLIDKMKLWLQIAKRLHTSTIQIPANFLPGGQLTGDLEVISADLRKLADMGAAEQPVMRFAYENLCWSTHIDTWEKAWEVVERVDRPNFGMCLDTFNIAGLVWADPTSTTGKRPDGDSQLLRSMERLVQRVDINKVFYIQVVDAERMEQPLVEGHDFHVDGQPPRMSWSRNARTFMYESERGAYLPAERIAKVIIDRLGYNGFVSMELFSRTMSEEGAMVPRQHAQRGITAWQTLVRRLGLQ